MCIIYEDEINSFFGQRDTTAESSTYAQIPYQEGSFSTRGSGRRPNNSEYGNPPIPSPTPDAITQQPSSEPDPISEPVSEPTATPEITPEPVQTYEPTPTPAPMPTPSPTSAPTPEPTVAALEPTSTVDLFACLGRYEDDYGNSIELRLDTSFNKMRYGMRLYFGGGSRLLRGRNGQRMESNLSKIVFSVTYDNTDYPFTIEAGDGYIMVPNSNQFGDYDGHEFAGTYHMTKQYTVPDWIRNS